MVNVRVIVRDKTGDVVSLALIRPSNGREIVDAQLVNASNVGEPGCSCASNPLAFCSIHDANR